MMPTIWFYREIPPHHVLSCLPLTLETALGSADARLKAFNASVVDIVYPLPWTLDDKHALSAWHEFYNQALLLKHEFGGRVNLYALDTYLKAVHGLEGRPPCSGDLKLLAPEMDSAETADLLEQLERCAKPADGAEETRKTRLPVTEISTGTEARLALVQREAKSLLSQLHLCQAELEALQLKHQALTKEVQLSQLAMENASRLVLSLKVAGAP